MHAGSTLATLVMVKSVANMQSIEISRALESWYARDSGEELYSAILQRLEPVLALSFGYHILQIGPLAQRSLIAESPINHQIYASGASDRSASLYCHGDELPLESDSIDTVVAFHALEFDEHPHGSLREMQRVLRPHGHLIVVGFNPYSLLGAIHYARGLQKSSLWNRQRHRPVSLHRLTDWLRLLDCELESAQHLFPLPPAGRPGKAGRAEQQAGQGRWRQLAGGIDAWAAGHGLPGGSVYIAHAIKQIAGIRRPRSLRVRAKESFRGLGVAGSPAPAPQQPRTDNSDLAA
ncbi:Methylase involved in ubiquinone/menaquinone biosynthesis [Congregibacter litoralis KT71]|uniref:Methylase involved in ubiquinone/menaquinone biosynthesis n=2 Tax=Congregibacter TaxID=393661 RepID=A4A344_9GAMM|nr:Methylase involved in ubiquinone/menaquinone biosynthesis [Congregibacter litoralis KT71]